MSYTQQNRLLSLNTPLGDDILLLIGFTGKEGLTRPSRFTLNTISEYDIDVESLIGQPVNFDVELDDGSYRVFNGIVDQVKPKGLINGSFRRYQLKVITRVDMMKMRTDNRHFQNKTHRDILKEVLTDHHVNLIDLTSRTYQTRDYCVQYQESDFKFVHRLLKEEGINYYITHETGKHTVVLFDNKARYRGHNEADIEYVDGDSSKRKFYNWHKELTLPTGQVAQRSFNYKRPLDPINSKTSTVLPVNKAREYEYYHYPALNNELQASGDESRRAMEAEENVHTQVTVSTNCRSLEAGQTFSFSRHEVDNSECSNDYVITTIHYHATDDTYLNQPGDTQRFDSKLHCIPSDTLYRTAKKYPRPTTEGVQTAIVCGPAGEEIYTDKLGRVKVQFHWDRLNKRDENSSCWIRVAHQWAGAGYGSLYIPRIGQEVMVYFEDGDINKPLIYGGIYNGKNSTAQGLPANKTQTGMKSRSTKSADPAMFNEMRFDDKKGEEELYLQAQKNQTTIVKDSHVRVIGGDQNLSVGNDRFDAINQDRTAYVAEGSDSLQAEKDINYQSVDGSIYMHAAEFIEFITGDASLTMYADGSINVNGKIIHIDGNGGVTINGGAGVSRGAPTPMKIDNIYTTPAGPGAVIPKMTVTPEFKTIKKLDQHHLSRAVLAKAAFKPEQALHTIDVKYTLENQQPVKDIPIRITDAAGVARSTFLDDNGQAHMGGLQPGPVKVEYLPDLTDSDLIAKRQAFKTALDSIISAEREEAADLQSHQDTLNIVENALLHKRAADEGLKQAGKDAAIFMKDTAELASIAIANSGLKALWSQHKEDYANDFVAGFVAEFAENYKNEWVDIIGFDPTQVTKEQLAQAYEMLVYLWDDPEAKQMLLGFAKDFALAQDSTEFAEMTGGAAFEIILGAILCATGAGAAIAIAKNVRHADKLGGIGDALDAYVDTKKEFDLKDEDIGDSNDKIESEGKLPDPVDIRKLPEIKVPCFHPYDNKKTFQKMSPEQQKSFLKDYQRQLDRQQNAINKMTAEQFQVARKAFDNNKRNFLAKKMQKDAREKFLKKIKNNISESIEKKDVRELLSDEEIEKKATMQAKAIMDKLAALHDPDMVAGGYNKPQPAGIGRKDVNGSIGPSWPSRVGTIDTQVDNAMKANQGSAKLNVKLEVCRGKGLR